ncbi:MAG: preprotein translocase subunit YajC [Hespellia sp.]|nr:preprotein translocase subunit YajC [Hespellia sp.]
MNGIIASSSVTSWGSMILIYAVLIGAMWFFLMRPQKKEQKRITAMLSTMEVGDTALTTSGFYGVIIDITEEDVIVEFGNNKNCRIPMQKSAIAQIEKPNAE